MIVLTSRVPLSIAFLDMIGGSELLVVFLLVLIFFGGEKMPEFARGLGKVVRELRKAASGVEDEFKRAMEEEPKRPAPPVYPPTPTILPPPATTPPTPSSPPAAPPTAAATAPATPVAAPLPPVPPAAPPASSGELDAG